MKTRTTAIDWRAHQLLDAGFGGELAARVAGDARFDLHAVIELVERGCPPELAVRILAPLEPSVSEDDQRRL
jgi:hypothetical protein